MRYNDLINGFTDLGNDCFLVHPLVVLKPGESQASMYNISSDLLGKSTEREVMYEDDSGSKYYMVLVPYVHPSGAPDLTIGTLTTAADGTVTYTPTQEGRLISETGVLVPDGAVAVDAETVAGMLFTDYYTHFDGNPTNHENSRVITISEGDFLWLVRRGECQLDATAAVNSGDYLVSSSTIDGEVRAAVAINVGGTIPNYNDTLQEHLTGIEHKALAVAKETIGAPGLVDAWLLLPERYSR